MRRLSAALYCCLFLTLLFLAALPLSAQVTGRVVGAVVDQQKRALPNAHVSLFRPNGSEPLVETQTTSAWNFVLDSITPGVYRLVIDLPSFSNFEVANLTVSPGADTPLNNVVLEVGATKSSVETVATSDAPQMSNAELSTTLSHDQLQELPQSLHDPLEPDTDAGGSLVFARHICNYRRIAPGLQQRHPRRHQRAGQLLPGPVSRLPAEPAFSRSDIGIHAGDFESKSDLRWRRHAGRLRDAIGNQRLPRRALLSGQPQHIKRERMGSEHAQIS